MKAEAGTVESRVVMVLKFHLGHVQVWEGDGVVKSARKLIGSTNPLEAEPGTIRGDLAVQTGRNVVHGSDSPENGERETGADVPLVTVCPFVVIPMSSSCAACIWARNCCTGSLVKDCQVRCACIRRIDSLSPDRQVHSCALRQCHDGFVILGLGIDELWRRCLFTYFTSGQY